MTVLDNNKQLQALRAAYKKNLLANVGITLIFILAGIFLLGSQLNALSIEWGIALGLSMVWAAVEYCIERALFKKSKNTSYLPALFFIVLIMTCVVLWKLNMIETYTYLFWPFILGFLIVRPLFPTVDLLRDYGRLKKGDLCETVGRIKKNSRQRSTAVGRDIQLLFEDELTHEVHLLRTGSLSPRRRYRVFYLPHSGLAVGKPISDEVSSDSFGNPIEQEDTEEDEATYET